MNRKGFTLVEILTVVSIMSILFGLSITTIVGVRERARDNQRINDLKSIQSALELYRTDVDRGTTNQAGVTYGYPLYYLGPTGTGIYPPSPAPNPLQKTPFESYLSSTPTDPMTKKPYVYFGPGCLRPGIAPGQPVVISPARDAQFHTQTDISASAALATRPCPSGSGWLPYVIATVTERPISGRASVSNTANLVTTSNRIVVLSVAQPVYAPNEQLGNAAWTYIGQQSYCYPYSAGRPTCLTP